MNVISNSLTNLLDKRILNTDLVDQFIDDLEDEIFGLSNRDFYLKYKGDIKELLELSENSLDDLSFESELLRALMVYRNQRKAMTS